MSKLLTTLVVLALSASALVAATTVTVQPSASVRPMQMIRLGEFASVTGPKVDVERLNQLEITRSAMPGSARQISPEWIKTRVACAGLDARSVTIKSPATIVLISASQPVKGSDIVEAAKLHVTSQLSLSDLAYTVSETGSQSDILVPAGKLELVAEQSSRAIAPGRLQVCVNVLVDGALYVKKNVGLNLKASGSVLVASHTIKAKEPLSGANTRVEMRDIASSSIGYLSALSDVEMIAGRSISAGTVITADMIAARPAVSKGDPVVVSVRATGVKVVVKGTASQDGMVGDNIRISVPTTKEQIGATVVQPGVVEVRI